jgi:hypothetical protein
MDGKSLDLRTSDTVATNVVVGSHLTYGNPEWGKECDESKVRIGYPSTIGQALSPKVGQKFNSLLLAKRQGTKRVLSVRDDMLVNTKSSAPTHAKPFYSIETGLAEYFKDIRG